MAGGELGLADQGAEGVGAAQAAHAGGGERHRLPSLGKVAFSRPYVPRAGTGLVKRFGDREALRGVELRAAPGELVAVIGPNGAGKTTLLSILAGILDGRTAASSSARRRGGRLGAPAGGALPAADRGGEPAAVRPAGEARRPARLGRGDAGADRARRAPRRDRRPPLRRQPAADQHRDRPALAAQRAAAGRAERRPRPAPAGAPLGVRLRPRRARDDGDLLHPRHPGGRALRRPDAGAGRRRGALRRARRRAPRGGPHARRPRPPTAISRPPSSPTSSTGGTERCAGCCSRTCRSSAARRCRRCCWSSTRC